TRRRSHAKQVEGCRDPTLDAEPASAEARGVPVALGIGIDRRNATRADGRAGALIYYKTGRSRRGFTGNASSSARISARVSPRSPALALSSTCWIFAALGTANTCPCCTRNASATWRGETLRRSAIDASTRPPPVRSDGNRPLPNGLYATTATPCSRHHGITRVSIERSFR